jgi:hypothetical protein
MPHFNAAGHDTYICQVCTGIFDAVTATATWRPDVTGNVSAGNVCPGCLEASRKPSGTPAGPAAAFAARYAGTDARTGSRFAAGTLIVRCPGGYAVAEASTAARSCGCGDAATHEHNGAACCGGSHCCPGPPRNPPARQSAARPPALRTAGRCPSRNIAASNPAASPDRR